VTGRPESLDKISYGELKDILFSCGLTYSEAEALTGVSRQKIAAIAKGGPARATTVGKILTALEAKGFAVRAGRRHFEEVVRKVAGSSDTSRQATQQRMRLVEAKSAAYQASQALLFAEKAAEAMSALLSRVRDGDRSLQDANLKMTGHYLTKARLDFDMVADLLRE
jgi:hypothetical protein